MSSRNKHHESFFSNPAPAPEVHSTYADLDEGTRQKLEAADKKFTEAWGPDTGATEPIFGGANHVHVAYAELDETTRQRIEAADRALAQLID